METTTKKITKLVNGDIIVMGDEHVGWHFCTVISVARVHPTSSNYEIVTMLEGKEITFIRGARASVDVQLHSAKEETIRNEWVKKISFVRRNNVWVEKENWVRVATK